ncbi:MAG: helix-turn-helix domain-containing protein [Pseudomonadota bacterium]|jgi:transcriptional regulator with XRE-family HTH domain|nr:helix-turn-helix domain-containing protein [Xanthomonadales bacterium]MBN8794217.1 helix-turn-helix domain-containing protein [Stenotrophomonas nitritireducens]
MSEFLQGNEKKRSGTDPATGWTVRHPDLRTIGQRLAYIRASIGGSQADMAGRIGVALRTWQNYEQDRRSPDAQALVALFRLGWSPTWVLTGMEAACTGEPGTTAGQDGQGLMVSHELAEEALRGLWLPKHQFFALMARIHAWLMHGRPYGEILEFARTEAARLAQDRNSEGNASGIEAGAMPHSGS